MSYLTKEQKEILKESYKTSPTIRHAFKAAETSEWSYRKEILTDKDLEMDMLLIRQNKQIARSRNELCNFDKELFLERLEYYKDLAETCRSLGISVKTYYRKRKGDEKFILKTLDILRSISSDKCINSYQRSYTFNAQSHGWTPPNQDLITYPRWR